LVDPSGAPGQLPDPPTARFAIMIIGVFMLAGVATLPVGLPSS